MKERVRSTETAKILGVSTRMVVKMAANGNLPGAAKIGGTWTFDKEKLRRFILEKEYECQRKTSTYETVCIGYKLPSAGNSSDKAYTQAMLKLLGKSGTKQLSR